MSKHTMAPRVAGALVASCRALALGAALLAGSATMLSATHARAEKILRIGSFEPQSMDPHFVTIVQSAYITDDMFLNLLTYGPDGTPIPGAAESWTVSGDGLTYIFKIRDHDWSDGVPVTAGDFVAAWNRILDPALGAKYASLLYIIDGAQDVNTGKKGAKLAAEALDDHTLRVRLTAPAPYFLAQLTHETAATIPRHVVEKYGKDWVKPEHIAVNGAYKLVEWLPKVHVKLTKNQKFYDVDNIKVDQVIYYPIADLVAAQNRFRAEELDICRDIASQQIPWLRAHLANSLHIAPYNGIYYYTVRTTKDMFKDVRVRRALSMAINREAIVNGILKGGQLPAYSFVPPGTANYGEPAYVSWKGLSYADKLAEARKLMREAGYGPDHPLKFTLSYNTLEDHKRIAVAVQNMWKQIGVEAELFNTEGNVHFANLHAGNFDVGREGWIADYDDAQNYLYLGEKRTGPLNDAAFDDPRYNELMLQAERESDLGKRAGLMKRAEAIMMDAQPYIPIYYYASKQLVSPKIKGWIDNTSDHHLSRWLDIAE